MYTVVVHKFVGRSGKVVEKSNHGEGYKGYKLSWRPLQPSAEKLWSLAQWTVAVFQTAGGVATCSAAASFRSVTQQDKGLSKGSNVLILF